jgi:Nucleoporin complex subunit 54
VELILSSISTLCFLLCVYVYILQRLQNTVEALQQAVHRTDAAMESSRRRHLTQTNRFLELMAKVELVRCMNLPLNIEEMRLREKLEHVRHDIQKPQADLNEVVTLQQQVERRVDTVDDIVNADDLAAIFKVSVKQNN